MLSSGAQAFVVRSSELRGISAPISTSSQRLSANGDDGKYPSLQRLEIGNQTFWAQQKELAEEMSFLTTKSLRQEQAEKFEKRRLALVSDTAYFAMYIFCACWMLFDNPFTAFSYAFGASMGLAYSYGLGKSVETIGASVDEVGAGAGVGEARFAFLIILFIFVGKFRGEGLQEIPSIAGFFTYQLASLNQGLREIND
jgi:hypothetical protein